MDGRYLSEIKKKWPHPENLPKLQIPGMDEVLKTALKGDFEEHKKNDAKMSKVQELLVTVLGCALSTLDYAKNMIRDHNLEPMEPVVTSLHEIVAFNMKAFGDMTEARRAFIRSDLNVEFKDVLGDRNPASEKWLGGEDLRQVMDDIKKDAKSADMLKKNQKKKGFPS